MLVCWDSIHTLEIITRILREVVNRERLYGTNAFYFGRFRNLWVVFLYVLHNQYSTLYACMRGFRRTLEIIARTLREVVNRVRLCGHHTRRSSHGEVHVYGAPL